VASSGVFENAAKTRMTGTGHGEVDAADWDYATEPAVVE
jgi:hypothetical protein